MHASKSENTSSSVSDDAVPMRLAFRAVVNRFDLLHHHESGHAIFVHNGHMKWIIAVCIRGGSGDADAGVLVEQIVADNGGPGDVPLLMA